MGKGMDLRASDDMLGAQCAVLNVAAIDNGRPGIKCRLDLSGIV